MVPAGIRAGMQRGQDARETGDLGAIRVMGAAMSMPYLLEDALQGSTVDVRRPGGR